MRPKSFIDLSIVRRNAVSIGRATGVDVLAVIKADAYGLGVAEVVRAIHDVVAGFYVFHPHEVIDADIRSITNKPTIAAVPLDGDTPELLKSHNVRPGVWTVEQAKTFADCDPVLCVDTGMQRFAAPFREVDSILKAAPIREAFTHASRPEQAIALWKSLGGRGLTLHAAGSALLNDPACRLDAVRPGLALYANAVRVVAPIVDARDSLGPVGYGGFSSTRHGVILAGYSHGLRAGPVSINGRTQRILEVGMQSAYVSLDARDVVGDEVELLGPAVSAEAVARAWNASPHEVLHRLARLGSRVHLPT